MAAPDPPDHLEVMADELRHQDVAP